MAKEDITISTVPVSIKVVEVGNKKMTISVFNQIPKKLFFYDNHKDGFIGWVRYKETKYILYVLDNIILKDEVHYIPRRIALDYEQLISGRRPYDYEEDREEKSREIIEKHEKAKNDFLNRYNDVLKNENQIYIAV
jgi:hypothetical protein